MAIISDAGCAQTVGKTASRRLHCRPLVRNLKHGFSIRRMCLRFFTMILVHQLFEDQRARGRAGRPRSSASECRGRDGPARLVGAEGERHAVIEQYRNHASVVINPPRPFGLLRLVAFEKSHRRRRRPSPSASTFMFIPFRCRVPRREFLNCWAKPNQEPIPHLCQSAWHPAPRCSFKPPRNHGSQMPARPAFFGFVEACLHSSVC